MPTSLLPSLDQQKLIRHFNRAAKSYDTVAVLQQEVGRRMLQRLELIKVEPKTILDLGCGTGFFTSALKKRFPHAQILSSDIAYNMLTMAKKKAGWLSKPKLICAAAEQLPFAPQSIDVIFSNQVFAWCPDLIQTFKEITRVLTPGGLLLFSTLGPDTLKELRASWQSLDAYTHVHPFLDMHDLGDMLVHSRLADPVMDMEYLTLTYAQPQQLLQELKASGATNAGIKQAPGLMGKAKWEQCLHHYEQFRTEQSLLPATFEIVYGHAWQPLLINRDITSGEIAVPLSNLRKRRS